MPWADDQVILQIALANRSAGVRANSRQRVQLTGRVADCVGIFSERDFHHRAGRQRSEGTDFYECHESFLPRVCDRVRRV